MSLDTNVLSALMSVPPAAAVLQWMDERAADRLFITATTSLYSVVLNRQGAQRP